MKIWDSVYLCHGRFRTSSWGLVYGDLLIFVSQAKNFDIGNIKVSTINISGKTDKRAWDFYCSNNNFFCQSLTCLWHVLLFFSFYLPVPVSVWLSVFLLSLFVFLCVWTSHTTYLFLPFYMPVSLSLCLFFICRSVCLSLSLFLPSCIMSLFLCLSVCLSLSLSLVFLLSIFCFLLFSQWHHPFSSFIILPYGENGRSLLLKPHENQQKRCYCVHTVILVYT